MPSSRRTLAVLFPVAWPRGDTEQLVGPPGGRMSDDDGVPRTETQRNPSDSWKFRFEGQTLNCFAPKKDQVSVQTI